MRTWSITDARANISNVFDEALKSGPQKIERRDSEPVVMVAEIRLEPLGVGILNDGRVGLEIADGC